MEVIKQHVLDFITVHEHGDYIVTEWSNGTGYGDGYGEGQACGGEVHAGICITEKPINTSLQSISYYNGLKVYFIENMPFVLYNVIGKAAYAGKLLPDMSIKRGVLVRYGDSFAFAESAKDAFDKARELSIKRGWKRTVPDPAKFMLDKYPDPDCLYPIKELLELHNILTGSCLSGREDFIRNNGLDITGKATLRDFFNYSKYVFGKETIAEVAKIYEITI
jgi:hypothetical protein